MTGIDETKPYRMSVFGAEREFDAEWWQCDLGDGLTLELFHEETHYELHLRRGKQRLLMVKAPTPVRAAEKLEAEAVPLGQLLNVGLRAQLASMTERATAADIRCGALQADLTAARAALAAEKAQSEELHAGLEALWVALGEDDGASDSVTIVENAAAEIDRLRSALAAAERWAVAKDGYVVRPPSPPAPSRDYLAEAEELERELSEARAALEQTRERMRRLENLAMAARNWSTCTLPHHKDTCGRLDAVRDAIRIIDAIPASQPTTSEQGASDVKQHAAFLCSLYEFVLPHLPPDSMAGIWAKDWVNAMRKALSPPAPAPAVEGPCLGSALPWHTALYDTNGNMYVRSATRDVVARVQSEGDARFIVALANAWHAAQGKGE
jgi:hypothetical protein